MHVIDKLRKAYNKIDLFIQPSPPLFKRILIIFDLTIMKILYHYNIDDFFLYEFYRLKLSARRHFIGQDNGIKRIAQPLNSTNDIIKFHNKSLFNFIFAEYLHRRWLLMSKCTYDDFCNFCRAHSSYLKKPIDQMQGKGIEKHTILQETNLLELYHKLTSENCLIEEIIIQDEAISAFNPSSVNSCRLYSLLNKSKVTIIDAYLRMGVGNVIIDNQHAGGIAAKIDVDTGIVITHGKNRAARTFILHPLTNKQIIGFIIPRWDDIKKTIEEAAFLVPTVRYVAWDVVIDSRGNICLLEGNHLGGFNIQEATDMVGKKSRYAELLQDIECFRGRPSILK